MSQRFLTPLNLLNSSSDPSAGETGDLYYNTASSLVKYYNGSTWATLQTGAVGAGLTANTFTGTQTITPSSSVTGLVINGAASSIGAIVKANATTPGDLQQWQNSSSTVLAKVDSSGIITANQFITTNNGNGTNFQVGDDVWLGDINVANTMSLRGGQSAASGFIRFGSDTNALGYNGTAFSYGGAMTATSFNSITGLSSTNPTDLGTVAVGTGTTAARADHVHPTTGLATSGANSNITSLSGLTTALSVAQGGTGTGTASLTAFNNITGYTAAGTTGTTSTNLVFSASPTFTGTVNTAAITTTGAVSINTAGTGTINLGDGIISKSSGTGFQFNSGADFSQSLTAVNLTLSGNLTVNGTTTTLNSNTLTVDDKNLELGSVAAAVISATGTVGTVSGSGPFTATITGMAATTGLIPGQVITATAGTGSFGSGVMTVVSIVSSSSITVSSTLTFTAGTVTNILGQAATDATANGGGITLKGATDKTLTWISSTGNWTSNVGVEATSFVRTSGTSSQFLKGDGSVDTSTYLTTGTASSTYAPLASPSLTGTPLSTTAAVDTNTTQIATTAYVVGQGYLKSSTASTTYAPLASPTFTGAPAWPNSKVYGFTRTMPTVANNIVELGSSTLANGAGSFEISIVVPSSAFSLTKQYLIPVNYDETGNNWRIVNPIADGGPYVSEDFTLEINVSLSVASFRIRRTTGTTAGTAYVSLKVNGNAPTFTESSATASVTAPTTYYNGAIITQKDGAATVNGNLTATQFIRSGGTSAQFLKADGSIDSSTYLTSASGVTTVNGSSGAITNVAITSSANTFTTTQTITPATSVTGLAINAAASSTGLVVKSNATTPGNIQEWQNSSNSVVMSVSPTVLTSSLGSNIFTGDARVGTSTYFNSSLSVGARIATEIGTVVRGFTSQSADLQQWQSSASTVLSGVTAAGYIYSGPSYVGGQVSILTANAGNRALVIRGSASQSSDLTQWQDSTGTVLANVNAAGAVTASSIIKTGGTSAQYLMADGSTTTVAALPDIIPLDDISGAFNGIDSRFVPRYQGIAQTITNPLRLMLSINGIIQYVDFADYVWQSPLPREGFQVDNDGYIAFSEVVPAGSSFDARIMPGPSTAVNTRRYPFKPVDILLGG